MTNWNKFWATYPLKFGSKDYFKQVGKTVNGQPISDYQFKLIISDICNGLDLEKTDVVLDLCCGNGIITKEIAGKCKEVVGVDFSQPLLEVAKREHSLGNIKYVFGSVLDLDKILFEPSHFNEVIMYEGLQNFKKKDLLGILRNIQKLTGNESVIFIGSIPDKKRIWKFYNTPKRRLLFLCRKLLGGDAIGSWWDKDFIKKTCKKLDLCCEFREQSKGIHTAHYRFDIKIQ